MLMTEWQLFAPKALPRKNGPKTRKNGSVSVHFGDFQPVSMWFEHASRPLRRRIAARGSTLTPHILNRR